MKTKFFLALVSMFMLSTSWVSARELTYKFGVGYRQVSTNARVADDAEKTTRAVQLNGLDVSYGVAPDLTVGAYFGLESNFDFTMVGPTLRYDVQRLFARDATVWNNLNIFVEAAFFAKFGKSTKAGICIHAPYIGFEILPFSANNFAISTSAGMVIDFVQANKIGFTNGMFGDVGVKYYF